MKPWLKTICDGLSKLDAVVVFKARRRNRPPNLSAHVQVRPDEPYELPPPRKRKRAAKKSTRRKRG